MDVKAMVKNQETIFNILKKSRESNRLSHAYLFYGDEGTGKKEMAYALACMLYCENGGCLECETCQAILSGNHMNVDYIGIAEKKTVITKEQIEDLQDEFSKTSLVDGTRIYIVDGIDTASAAAQNSLLKFIEDPLNTTPTIGIFIAKDLSLVVPTILSRCALTHFKAIPLDKTIEALISNGLGSLEATLCAALTNDITEAIEISQTPEFVKGMELFMDFISLSKPKENIMFYLDNLQFYSDNTNLTRLIKWFILFLEDALFKGPDELLLTSLCDKIKVYKSRNENRIKDIFENVISLSGKMKYNVIAKNVFHELMTKLI